MLKTVLLRICSAIVSLAMLLTVGVYRGDGYDVKEPEKRILNFTVLSDCHIEGNNPMRYRIFVKSLQDVQKNNSGNDAIIFLGDSTMNGQHIENMLFHGTVRALLRGETVLPVIGNHDIGNGQGNYAKLQDRWYDYTSAFFGRDLDVPYYYEVIDGCYFIVLGMQAQEVYEMYMSDAQFIWLEDVLDKAAESGRPAFVFSHYPADDVTDANGEYTSRLTDMLAAYNREHDLFSFVGHTHMRLWMYWSFHTSDGYPETYLPRLTELSGEGDDQPVEWSGDGLEVELYEKEVVLRGRNFYRGEWMTEKDGTPVEVTYSLKNPVEAR